MQEIIYMREIKIVCVYLSVLLTAPHILILAQGPSPWQSFPVALSFYLSVLLFCSVLLPVLPASVMIPLFYSLLLCPALCTILSYCIFLCCSLPLLFFNPSVLCCPFILFSSSPSGHPVPIFLSLACSHWLFLPFLPSPVLQAQFPGWGRWCLVLG